MGAHLRAGSMPRWTEAPHIGLSIRVLDAPLEVQLEAETGFVLLRGAARLSAGGATVEGRRSSVFDDRPTALFAPAGATVKLEPGPDGAELVACEAPPGPDFSPVAVSGEQVRSEARGRGQLREAATRTVRTIADDIGQLVVGEVVTSPGRWSSYPPHHHRQPEIYHYRFTHPDGYGHAELGESVVKVRHGETVLIEPGETHAQCAAPGYGMWYLWVIRHLPEDRYDGPTFEPAHRWTTDPDARFWWPAE